MAVGSLARLDFPTASPFAPAAREGLLLGSQGQTLFLCVAAYLVAPLLDVPYWELSLSAPVLILLMTDAALRQGFGIVQRFLGWILVGAAIWFGQFVSLGANVGGMGDAVVTDAFLWLAKYAFWVAVFLLGAVTVARSDVGNRLAKVLAAAVIVLGLLRAGEGVLFGALGNAKSLLLEQNDYGWAFSTFFPFAVWWVFRGSLRWRWAAVLGLFVLCVAIAVNGSRASWVAVVIGTALTLTCLFLWSSVDRARNGLLLVLTTLVLGLASTALPSAWTKPVEERWQTLTRLDRDKSYAVRSLMVDKALRLFEGSPWFGVGVGRFRVETVDLELPPVLSTFAASSYQHRSAHNAYLGLLAESGIVGAAPVITLLLILGGWGVWAVRGHALRGETWAAPMFAGFAAMSVHLALLSGLTNTATWFVFGLVAGLIHRERRIGWAYRTSARHRGVS
ncbi:MAG: O-antigen ligase family protein [Acidobacteria bacterium]|nr:O-antigen ligase family protein [Acidobacteriota bacterium]